MALRWKPTRARQEEWVQVRRCSECGRAYVASRATCAIDGAALGQPTDQIRDLFLGQRIGDQYFVEGRIGFGGHGAVYLARQLSMDRNVAIKVLKEEASENKVLIRRFEREAKVVARLRHPNTVRVHDYGRTEDGRIFLVTEFLEGRPLDAILRDGPIGEALTLRILVAVCGSLAEAHEQGVIHRDLKPGNIFLANVAGETVVKVLDFGIAKLTEEATFTTGGDIYGTPAYIAPEQAKSDTIDGRTDLYSLGVVAYECLTGDRPFHSQTAMGLLMKHINETPPAFEEDASISADLRELVFGMLEKLPDDRPPSARTVRDLIAPIVLSQSLPRQTASSPLVDADQSTGPILWDDGSRVRWLVFAAVLGIAVSIGAWVLSSDELGDPGVTTPASAASRAADSAIESAPASEAIAQTPSGDRALEPRNAPQSAPSTESETPASVAAPASAVAPVSARSASTASAASPASTAAAASSATAVASKSLQTRPRRERRHPRRRSRPKVSPATAPPKASPVTPVVRFEPLATEAGEIRRPDAADGATK